LETESDHHGSGSSGGGDDDLEPSTTPEPELDED
jgi:hypothetical protein